MAEYKTEAQVNYGWGLTLNMTGKAPAVSKRIFSTKANALNYINDSNDSAIAGLILRVINDGANNGAYFVKGTDGNLSLEKIITTSTAGDSNVIESIKKNGTVLPITDKSVNITVPTKVSDLTNDSDFIGKEDATVAIRKSGNSYIVTQGGKDVNVKIDIPTDLVVSSGEIVTDPEGQVAGKYLKLVLNSETAEPIFINVADLVDVYKVADTDEVDLTISDNTISAEIKAKSIDSAKLKDATIKAVNIADGAVVTDKILDGAITTEKFDLSVYDTIIGSELDAITKLTILGVRRFAAYTAGTVLGDSNDTASDDTVFGAKKYTDAVANTSKIYVDNSITAVSNRLGWEEFN